MIILLSFIFLAVKRLLLQCVSHKVVSRKWKTLNSKSDLNGNSRGAMHLYSITLLVILKQFKFETHWTRKALSWFICHIPIGPVGPMLWTMWPLAAVPSASEPFIFALSISVEILTGHPGFAAQFFSQQATGTKSMLLSKQLLPTTLAMPWVVFVLEFNYNLMIVALNKMKAHIPDVLFTEYAAFSFRYVVKLLKHLMSLKIHCAWHQQFNFFVY